MRFTQTPLAGAFQLDIEPHADARGFFTRLRCESEMESHGLPGRFVQASLSKNLRRGTVRGMHLQLPPSREGKLVRCTRGRIFDVIVDLRPGSRTFLQHYGIELSAQEHNALYMPPQMLHGFQTLEDDCEVMYDMTDVFAPQLGFGARWNDPAFRIGWPITSGVTIIGRDAEYPDFDAATYLKQAGHA